MKNKVLLMLFVLLFCSVGFVFAKGQALPVCDNLQGIKEQKNTLILYYSKMGKTKILAEEARKLLPAAEFKEIKSDEGLMKAAMWNQLFNKDAAITKLDVDMSKYEKVILLSPIWFQKISSPARTVINTLSLQGKELQLIITCGGYFGEEAQEKLKKYAQSKGAEVIDFSVVKTGGKKEEELKKMVRKIIKN
jgi:flavodoxin